MEKIELITASGRGELTQESFNKTDAIYIVKSDYTVVEDGVCLPNGCSLIIDGGSINGGKIYLPYQGASNVVSGEKQQYVRLAVASSSSWYIENGEIYYSESGNVYLANGCRISSTKDNHYEMYLNCPCRVELPQGYPASTLYIESNKVNSIQIDGSSEFQLYARNCRLERIFACKFGWRFNNRIQGKECKNIFENCEIWTENCPIDPKDSSFLCVGTTNILNSAMSSVNTDPTSMTSETSNELVLRNSVVTNLGLGGRVNVENCTFLFGKNCNNNFETIHCGTHSRITNCLFDGRYNIGLDIPNLNSDVIDLFNGHDIVIDGCTFINYFGLNKAGCNIITVKSHYMVNPSDDPEYDNPANSDWIGAQNGVTIQNCHFDLPDFVGYIIEVWNGPKDSHLEDRSLNRRYTNIENNYMNCPQASFVNCFCYTDYLTVRNNMGSCRILVYIPDGVPGEFGNSDGNTVHNLTIDGNIIHYRGSDNLGYTILYGSHIDNLILSNNNTDRYLWANINNSNVNNLSGTIRVINNVTTESARGLVQLIGNQETVIRIPTSVNFFFSGNISRGKNTDIGPFSLAVDKMDSFVFEGRQFFSTSSPYKNQLMVFSGGSWHPLS